MNREKGRAEVVYQMTMAAAREMLSRGIITREEYDRFDTKMQQKYSPIFGNLLTLPDLK